MISSTPTIDSILQDTPDLPSIPAAALAVIRETDSPTSSAQSVARHIAQDQALTARVLRLANSAYYGLPRQVVDLQEAVVVLGMRSSRNLAVVAAAQPMMSRPIGNLDPEVLWNHSFAVAVASQVIAKKSGMATPESAFVAGLLHNIGKVAFGLWLGARLGQLIQAAARDQVPLYLVEQRAFGFDHAQIGARLGEQWNLPEVLTEAILYHHEPDSCPSPNAIVDCVHVADHFATQMGMAVDGADVPNVLQATAVERLRILDGEAETWRAECEVQLERHKALFQEQAA